MAIIYVTGLSGVGTSSVLEQLETQGYNVLDTDYGYVKKIKTEKGEEKIWYEEKITEVLEKHKPSHLFMSGCYANQGKCYSGSACVALLKGRTGCYA